MFFFIVHGQEKSNRLLREEYAQMRHALRQLEARLAGEGPASPGSGSGGQERRLDTLDSLSMGDDQPVGGQTDNGLELHFDPQERVRR